MTASRTPDGSPPGDWIPGNWISGNGVTIRDLVPRHLRGQWVEQGLCPGRDLYTLFCEHVRARPGRDAVIDAERHLDYAALDREVRRVAAALAAAGLGARDIIGIRMPNTWRMVVAELAVAAIGAVALPYLPGAGRRDTTSLLGRARASAGIFGSAGDAEQCAELPHVRAVFTFGAGEQVRRSLDRAPGAATWSPSPVDPGAPARILVTSGSESEPKMIAYSHDAMAGGRANYLRALRRGAEPMRGLVLMSLASAYGSCVTHVGVAALGMTVLFQQRFDPPAVLRAVTAHRPTHLFAVPAMLRRLCAAEPSDGEDLSSLRAVVSSAAALPEDLAAACRRRFGADVISVYGSADGINCHTARTGTSREAGTGLPDPAVAAIRVVDADDHPLPPGTAGEIQARGPMTPLCYVAAPDLDRRYRTDDGWVRSGDQGRIDAEGRLHVLGRLKDVVKRGGLSISPAEVEQEIGLHPDVLDAACVTVPDDELGERLCACVCPVPERPQLSLAALADFLERERGLERRKLPELVVVLPELPLAPTGKPCRRTLTAIATEHAAQARAHAAPGGTPD